MSEIPTPTFADFGLIDAVLAAVNDVGYETPTPIQIPTIPHLLAGRDVVGQAQTGTGKTAAFALPLLSRLDLKLAEPQVLVLTPTRELAIQVAEAFQSYASHLQGIPRTAGLRRSGLRGATAATEARRARHRRHAGPPDGSHAPRHAETRRVENRRARRSRRNAAHGLHRRRRVDSRADTGRASDRALLRDDAYGDPAHRASSTCAIRQKSRSSCARPPPRRSINAIGSSPACTSSTR